MTDLSCWQQLGIEATDDAGVIRRAYARLLQAARGSGDPAALQRLRDAYVGALAEARRARTPEAVPGSADANTSPVATSTGLRTPPTANPAQPADTAHAAEDVENAHLGDPNVGDPNVGDPHVGNPHVGNPHDDPGGKPDAEAQSGSSGEQFHEAARIPAPHRGRRAAGLGNGRSGTGHTGRSAPTGPAGPAGSDNDDPQATGWLEQLYTLLEDHSARTRVEHWQPLLSNTQLAELGSRQAFSWEVFGALAGWLRQEPTGHTEWVTRHQVIHTLNQAFGWQGAEAQLATRFHREDIARMLTYCKALQRTAPPPAAPTRRLRRIELVSRLAIVVLIVAAAISMLLPGPTEHPALDALRAARYGEALELGRAHLREYPQDNNMRAVMAEAYTSLEDYSAALTLMQTVLDSEPTASRYTHRASIYERAGDWANATLDRRAALDASSNDAALKNALAWNLATAPDPYVRDGAAALRLAQEATAAGGARNAAYVDTLAAAWAETGDFEAAAREQRRAITLAGAQEAQSGGYADRLELFEALQPYRQPQHATAPGI